MITRFMRDTPLAAIEIEMQLIPSFTPRASGTFRSQQRYVNPNPILYELFIKKYCSENTIAIINEINTEKNTKKCISIIICSPQPC